MDITQSTSRTPEIDKQRVDVGEELAEVVRDRRRGQSLSPRPAIDANDACPPARSQAR